MSSISFYDLPLNHFDRLLNHSNWPLAHVESCPGLRVERNSNTVPSRTFKPKIDLYEDSEKNLVSAIFELPGVKKEDVELEVRDGLLTISGESKSSAEDAEQGYIVRERRFGKFLRSLKLPRGITDQDIKASMLDGILTVTFPRSSPEQEPKKISVL